MIMVEESMTRFRGLNLEDEYKLNNWGVLEANRKPMTKF
jgi:hypothetical protein